MSNDDIIMYDRHMIYKGYQNYSVKGLGESWIHEYSFRAIIFVRSVVPIILDCSNKYCTADVSATLSLGPLCESTFQCKS